MLIPSPSILARWMSEEKTLWRRSEEEQISPRPSAELSKLPEEAWLTLFELKQNCTYI